MKALSYIGGLVGLMALLFPAQQARGQWLMPDSVVVSNRAYQVVYQPQARAGGHVTATLQDGARNVGNALFVLQTNLTRATLYFSGGDSFLLSLAPGTTNLVKLPAPLPGSTDAVKPPAAATKRRAKLAADLPPAAADAPATVDVLIVYTPAAAQSAGTNIANLATMAVAEANQAYADSQVYVTLNLVGAVPVNYTEGSDMNADLTHLSSASDPSLGATVAALREQYRADMVCLFAICKGSYAGLAYILSGNSDWAFSVVDARYAVGSFVFPHELGHNFGCAHDRQNAGSSGVFPYSYGNRFYAAGTQYRTIMAYAPGIRIGMFSSPILSFQGSPTGTATEDNARTMNERASTIAALRTAGNRPPAFPWVGTTTVLQGVATNLIIGVGDSDTAGANLTLTASSDHPSYVDVAVTRTNANAGTNGSTFTVTCTPKAPGSATVTLVAADGTDQATCSFTVRVLAFNATPSFVLSTNRLLVAEDAGAITNAAFLTNISPGSTNEASQTWTFSVSSTAGFAYKLAPSIRTNGTLVFQAGTNATGTNLITVVMKDNGGTANGARDSLTNTFQLVVTPVNDAPWFTGLAARTVLEDSPTNLVTSVTLIDPDTDVSGVGVTVSSSNTNLVGVALTGTNRVNATNALLTLTITPRTNAFGTAAITLVADDGGLQTTNSFNVTVTPVNDPPAFTLATNVVTVAEDAGIVTNAGFLTNLSVGPTNEAGQTWSFMVTSTANFGYKLPPAIGTNGTLVFQTATNANGTNVLTVVMKDSGGIANRGRDAVTNTFKLVVTPVNDAPWFTGLAARTLLEDSTTDLTTSVTLIDPDTDVSGVGVTVSSSNTNLVGVSLAGTNRVNATNATLTLRFAPQTNAFGTATITLVADDGGLQTTNSFSLTVTPVNDPPAFSLTTNVVIVAEDAGIVTNAGFLTNLSVGPTNEAGQTWGFTVTSTANFGYKVAPAIRTNGTLVFQTATNANGTNLLTVVMKDSGGTANGGRDSATNTFQLVVTPVNDAPVLVGLVNKTILEDARTNLAFSIWDPDSTSFNLAAVSSDTNLVTVALSGSGTNRVLQCAAVTNANGTATLTVTVDDGSLATTNRFTLTVLAVNDPPSFSLSRSNVIVDQFSAPFRLVNLVTNISAGPANETNQAISFLVSNNAAALFAVAPGIDTNGTLTFTPRATAGTATVTVYARDNGGKSNGGQDTSAGRTFVIQIPANPFTAAQGVYAGLCFATNVLANESSGFLRLVLTTNGTFSGFLRHAGVSNVVSGQFGISNPVVSVALSNSSCRVDLALDAQAQAISGTVADSAAGWTVPVLALRNPFSLSAPTPLAGEYLMAVPGNANPARGPSGDSVFLLIVNASGIGSVSGYLADDTPVMQITQVASDGSLPLYFGLGSTGSLSGWVYLTTNGLSRLSSQSDLVWIAESGNRYYPQGFTNQAVALGSDYQVNQASLLALTNGLVILSGGGLSQSITNAITLSNDIITVDPSATNGLKLNVFRPDGQITGQFRAPNGQTNDMNGVILQRTNVVRGYFNGPSQVGAFLLMGN